MAGSTTQQLSKDILLLIFVKGCEDYSPTCEHDEFEDNGSASLKPFAAKMRRVCSQWRSTIDRAPLPRRTSFWIAYAQLKFTMAEWSGLKETKAGLRSIYTEALVRFRRQLSASRNCDLAISFELICSNIWFFSLK